MKKEFMDGYKARAKELVSKMTLEEKCSQMLFTACAIPRLGIPDYNWWNECLHGIARGGTATVFPQAIGLAAAFDTQLLGEVAKVISDEGRARYNACHAIGDNTRYKGLTFWTPNINIFRDPRWGRGHETYGEDPYLTGRMGVAFIKGLQGDDERYLKASACAKHYLVHSGPEGERHTFDARVSKKDLYETYLPAFRDAVREGEVASVMGAYNRVDGEPCNGSPKYLQKVLREQLGFDGHVVSDCGAVCDFDKNHKVTDTREESAALAVRSGCDLNCGDAYGYLLTAVQEGLLTEAEIDTAVERLFTVRYAMGMMGDETPWDDIPFTDIDCPAHQAFNREVAGRTMVLLKNDGLLPFGENVNTVAVIGPTAKDRSVLRGNYEGTPSEEISLYDGIRERCGRALYAEGCHLYKQGKMIDNNEGDIPEAVLAARHADVAVLCLGLSPALEGEEGDGYNANASGDKFGVELPGRQAELANAVLDTGVPTVILLTGGSAQALGEIAQRAAAVIDVWYPGAQGGRAAADVLWGDVNPSGRLPVTFVKSTGDLPDFRNYDMAGRTYRYMDVEPEYPFGFGLSYTRFSYEPVGVEVTDSGAVISARVTNEGRVDGRESVQLYLKDAPCAIPLPKHRLAGLKTVELKAGESVVVTFEMDERALAHVDVDGDLTLAPGTFTAYVGGSQPDERSLALGAAPCAELPFDWTKAEQRFAY